jgi:hypothetical protein
MFLRNLGNHPPEYTVPYSRRPQLKCLPLWKSQISYIYIGLAHVNNTGFCDVTNIILCNLPVKKSIEHFSYSLPFIPFVIPLPLPSSLLVCYLMQLNIVPESAALRTQSYGMCRYMRTTFLLVPYHTLMVNQKPYPIIYELSILLLLKMNPANHSGRAVSLEYWDRGLESPQSMDVCVFILWLCAVLCAGSGLTTGWSNVQGVLQTV